MDINKGLTVSLMLKVVDFPVLEHEHFPDFFIYEHGACFVRFQRFEQLLLKLLISLK